MFIYRPGALGDALLAREALMALRAAYPRHLIELATHRAVGPLFESNSIVDRVVSQDASELLWLFATGASNALPEAPEIAIAWCGDEDGLIADSLKGAGARQIVVAPSRPRPGSRVHAADHLLMSLAPLGVRHAPDPSPLVPPGEARQRAHQWLDRHGVTQPFVAIHPGSGSARKNWHVSGFAETALLLRNAGQRLLLIAGPADEGPVADLRRLAGEVFAAVADTLPVDVLAGVLTYCAGYVGNDSGISHLAASLGVPTLALFGASDPDLWAPRGPHVHILADHGWDGLSPGDVARTLLGMMRV